MQAEVLRPYFLIALILGAFVLAFYILQPFLVPLTLAAIFAVVLRPLYRRALHVVRGQTSLAAASTILLFVLIVVVPVTFILSQIVAEATGLYGFFTSTEGAEYLFGVAVQVSAALSQWVPVTFNFETLAANADAYIEQGLAFIVSHLGGILSGVSGFILSLFLFFVALYYLLKDGALLKIKIMELSPLSHTDEERVFKRLEVAINSVVKGNLFIALIQGVVATIGFSIFGLPNPVLWGTVTSVSALIPAVGTSLVMIPAIVYLVSTGFFMQAFGLGVWAILAVGLIDNLLGPKLVGRGAGLHPLLILLSVLGGLAVFGAAGILLGPLAIALLIALLAIHADLSRAGT